MCRCQEHPFIFPNRSIAISLFLHHPRHLSPHVQKKQKSLHILVLSDFILLLPGRSSEEWGFSDMIDCFAFLFASWNWEGIFFCPFFLRQRLLIPPFTTATSASVCLFFFKWGTLSLLVQKFQAALLWNWFESLVDELVCFSHSPLLLLPIPSPPPPCFPPAFVTLHFPQSKLRPATNFSFQ